MSHEPMHSTTSSSGATDTRAPLLPIPRWARPIISTCDRVYAGFVLLAFILLIGLFVLVFFNQTGLPWLPKVIQVFTFCLVIGYTAMLIGRHDTMIPGWAGIVLAVAFKYGTPFAINAVASLGQVPSGDPFVQQFPSSFSNLAVMLATAGIVRLVVGYLIVFVHHQTRSRTKRIRYMDTSKDGTQKAGVVPKCWQMSRCRPGVRMTCPNYIDRKTCWKRRSGCFCDRELANYLMQSVDRKDAQEIIDVQRAVGSTGQNVIRGHMNNLAKARPWRLQKKLCHECPLFVEHQEYKYKHLSWLSWPATGLIVAASFQFFDMGYKLMANSLYDFMQQAAQSKYFPAEVLHPESTSLADSSFEYLVLAVLALLLASYVIQATEFLFLKWKI